MAATGRRLADRANAVLLAIAFLGLLTAGGAFLYNDAVGRRHSEWMRVAHQIQTDAMATSRIGDDVARGLMPDFAALYGQRENFDEFLRVLHAGDADAGTQAMPETVRPQIEAVDQAWTKMKRSMSSVLDGKTAVQTVTADVRDIQSAADELAGLYREALAKLIETGAATSLVGAAGEQLARTEQLQFHSPQMLAGGDAAPAAAKIGEVAQALAATHERLAADAAVGAVLKGGSPSVIRIAEAAKRLDANATAVSVLQMAAGALPGDGRNLFSAAVALEDRLGGIGGSEQSIRIVVFGALGIAAAALVAFAFTSVLAVRRRIRRAEENDAKQQKAILGLLDEISSLADGDLTVHANVTGDFTGAIADSINYTIETLRSLVGTINRTAVEIGAAAASTSGTAQAMQSASDTQAQEVAVITRQVTQSSQSLSLVAARAEQLAKSATESVNVAHNGASTVGRTIQGMAALREQIQDTAKRIKRLGESSQEIGNIIEFINDIAEQTNTLALNASIQAAMAGESGRGFAVVADEVQRLAERAAAATRQIETLVKTIQADTNEAIVSMERSTTNVVAGARSAEEAGQALTRIESSSNELARMIQEISGEARNEAAVAGRIAGQMQTVREVSMSTAKSAQTTASAVGELDALSGKLRESVAGFTLPAEASSGDGNPASRVS